MSRMRETQLYVTANLSTVLSSEDLRVDTDLSSLIILGKQ